MNDPILVFAAVGFRYGERAVLHDVTLTLEAGRVLGLLGPNGSGKTTAVRLAAGLLAPQAGRILLDGRPIRTLGRGEIARRVAVVPQGASLPEGFTGWDVVLAGRAPHRRWLGGEGADDRDAARRALALAGAEPLAPRRVEELSGGERQRLLLARALAQEPAVLLLDEPTAHLDLRHQVALLDRVRALAHETGLAVLSVFHELNLASEYCDELVLLREGRVLARGAPGDVLTAARIAEVYGVEVPVMPHPESGRPAVLMPMAGGGETEPGGGQEPSSPAALALTPALSPCAGRGCADVESCGQPGRSFSRQTFIRQHALAHRGGRAGYPPGGGVGSPLG